MGESILVKLKYANGYIPGTLGERTHVGVKARRVDNREFIARKAPFTYSSGMTLEDIYNYSGRSLAYNGLVARADPGQWVIEDPCWYGEPVVIDGKDFWESYDVVENKP